MWNLYDRYMIKTTFWPFIVRFTIANKVFSWKAKFKGFKSRRIIWKAGLGLKYINQLEN